jgi:hypothetical protein
MSLIEPKSGLPNGRRESKTQLQMSLSFLLVGGSACGGFFRPPMPHRRLLPMLPRHGAPPRRPLVCPLILQPRLLPCRQPLVPRYTAPQTHHQPTQTWGSSLGCRQVDWFCRSVLFIYFLIEVIFIIEFKSWPLVPDSLYRRYKPRRIPNLLHLLRLNFNLYNSSSICLSRFPENISFNQLQKLIWLYNY